MRIVRLAAPAALVLAGLGALLAGLALGGGAVAPEVGTDPGALVRYGLPTAKLLANLSAAVVIGALVLSCFALSGRDSAFGRAVDAAAASAAVWAVSSFAAGVLTLLSLGVPFSPDERFGSALASFLTELELGRAWLATTLIAAVLTVLCFAVRNQTALAVLAAGAMLGQIPLAAQGHAGGTADHDAAVTALWLHVVAASVWLGGLLVLALLSPALARSGRLGVVLGRYSSLALACFLIVAVSGYVRAEIAVGALDRLDSPYGLLVLLKVGALLVLGGFGALYRLRLLRGLSSGRSPARIFPRLAVAELAFMGVASGLAAALGRTAPPIEELPASELAEPSPAELLTGREVPPEPTPLAYLTQWSPDLLWIIAGAAGAFFYLAAVQRLRRRGDRWPLARTLSWLAGVLLLVYVTNGGIDVYGTYLFSAHMTAHMVLTMMVPVLLVPAAPITLLLRAAHKRSDGSRGVREWVLLAVHSRYAGAITHPVVAAVIFAGSLWVFYYTPLFSWATTDHLGHQWMTVHFLLSGYLFVQVLIGTDPMPRRASYPMRLVILLATMAFHAFFGMAIMTGSGLLLADWYGAMGREWGPTPLEDQRNGGGVAWSVGEIPTAALAVIVALQWARSDEREARRRDRSAERDDDAELQAYNRMLQARADAEQQAGRR